MLAAGDDERLDLRLDRRDGAVEMRNSGQRLDLGLVGEQDVDLAARRSAALKPSRWRSTTEGV